MHRCSSDEVPHYIKQRGSNTLLSKGGNLQHKPRPTTQPITTLPLRLYSPSKEEKSNTTTLQHNKQYLYNTNRQPSNKQPSKQLLTLRAKYRHPTRQCKPRRPINNHTKPRKRQRTNAKRTSPRTQQRILSNPRQRLTSNLSKTYTKGLRPITRNRTKLQYPRHSHRDPCFRTQEYDRPINHNTNQKHSRYQKLKRQQDKPKQQNSTRRPKKAFLSIRPKCPIFM